MIQILKTAHCYVCHHLFLFVTLPLPISLLGLLCLSDMRGGGEGGGGGWGWPILEGSFSSYLHPSPLPSLSPSTRVPSSESHPVLASVFPVELQEDKGKRHCVPMLHTHTHTQPSSSPPPFSSFTHILPLFLLTSPTLLLSSFSVASTFSSPFPFFLSITSPMFSVLWLQLSEVHINLQCVSVFVCVYTICHSVSCIGSPLWFAHSAVLRAQRPREHGDRWKNSRESGVLRVQQNRPNRFEKYIQWWRKRGDPNPNISLIIFTLTLYIFLSLSHAHMHTPCGH